MKYYLLLILAFLQSTLSNSNTTGKNSNISNLKWKTKKLHCKNFKCPPVENLLCVRMRAKKVGSKAKDFYMVLFNECELDYVKCHEGYQAVVVPMKNCGNHDKLTEHLGKERAKRSNRRENEKSGQDLSKSSNSEKDGESDKKESSKENEADESKPNKDEEGRIKVSDVQKAEDIDQGDDSQSEEGKDTEDNQSEAKKNSDDDQSKTEKDTDASEVVKDADDKKKHEDDSKKELKKHADDTQNETEKDTYNNKSEVEKDTDDNHSEVEKVTDNNESVVEKDTDDHQSDVEKHTNDKKSETEKHENDAESEGEKGTDATSSDEEDNKGKSLVKAHKNRTQTGDEEETITQNDRNPRMGYLFDYDLKAANDGVDFEEYEKECPSFCPAREVMICARCKDGIYRTFMSVCHLKMFNCAHPEEKAELVSRYPCVLSAPYLADVPTPKGRVAEAGDVDQVLQFIQCREKEELKRDDPKCASILQRREKTQSKL